MFNLQDPGRKSRSPSPVIGKIVGSRATTTHGTTTHGASVGPTTSMFDLSKKPAAQPHGYIPGARSRTQSQPPMQLPGSQQQEQPPAQIHADGGRKRSVSRESHAATTETKQPVEQMDMTAEEIYRLIPVGSQKIPHDEIVRLLRGYVALPKAFWGSELVYRQHIRYTKSKDNAFVRGGFIIGFGKQRGRATLTLANGFDPKKSGYYVWVIGLDAISHLFVKRESLKHEKPRS